MATIKNIDQHLQTMRKEVKSPLFWRDVFSEIVACFFLMSVQCSVVLGWGRLEVKGGALQGNLAMGMLIGVLCEIFGQFGGAHMNPAVSIGFLFARRITVLRAVVYTAAQLTGVSAGAAFTYSLTPEKFRETMALTQVREGLSVGQGLLSEIWVTTMLLLTVYGSTNSARRPVYMSSLVIGFYVFVAGCAAGDYSGGSMNPARSFGPALIMNTWKDHWVYWVGPITGSLLATFLFIHVLDRIGHPDDTGPSREMMTDIPGSASLSNQAYQNDGFLDDNKNQMYNSYM